MEVLIPIVALGGLAMSMKDTPSGNNANSSDKKKEGYSNINKVTGVPSNYPTNKNTTQIKDIHSPYLSPNDASAKYFDQNKYYQQQSSGKNVGNQIQQVYSLTGTYVDETDFKHNNMTPFHGGKTTQQTLNGTRSDAMLDNMSGSGTQYIQKQERAPLFKPEDNIQWSHGQPNMNDFFQSRSNSSQKFNNVKPFESEQVAPALNAGYNTNGEGGFNAGMEARDRYMPKSVDELRVATNPKLEYNLDNHQGPAASHVQNIGMMGKMEQHKPDTFFAQSEDRWLKTTSDIKAATVRSKQEVHDTARMHSESYTGIAGPGDKNANYIPGEYQETHRQQLPNQPVTNLKGTDAGFNTSGVKNSFNKYTNNRDLNNAAPQKFGSGLTTAIGAVIAPITDILNPTKKQEVVNNMRVYGNAGTTVQNEPMVDLNNTAPTTVKETTLYAPNTFMQNQGSDAYLVTQQQSIQNQRDTTTHSVMGGAGGASTKYGQTSYISSLNQTNNEKREGTIVGRTNHGNTQIFNTNMNVSIAKKEQDRNNNRMWAPSNMPSQSMSKELYGKMTEPATCQQNIAVERMAPELLTAFKENPYTHSLSGTALR